MNYFDSQGDDSTHHSLESLVLPPPPLSIFGDCMFDTKMASENACNSNLEKDIQSWADSDQAWRQLGGDSCKHKTPAQFLRCEADRTHYWDLVRELVTDDDGGHSLVEDDASEDPKRRILLAFHRLYEEYSRIFGTRDHVCIPSAPANEGDNLFQQLIDLDCEKNQPDSVKNIKDGASQTLEAWPICDSISNKFSVDSQDSSIAISRSFLDNIRSFFTPSFKCISDPKHKSTKFHTNSLINFDKISEDLEVFEVNNYKHTQTIHQIFLDKPQKPERKCKIIIPIALELLLPKIQIKIEKILSQCPFLCDPLEVISELRNCNYDYHKCVEYFQQTKSLRYLYSETQSELGKSKEFSSKNSNDNFVERNVYKHISFTNVAKTSESDLRVFAMECEGLERLLASTLMQTEPIENLGLYNSIMKRIKLTRQIQRHLIDDVHYLTLHLNKVFDSLKHHMITVINKCSEKLVSNEQKMKLQALSRQVEELKLKLKEEEKKRRQVYNRMQEQMGNIRVYCRCRKLTDDENVLEYIGEDTLSLTTATSERFEFDKLFQPGICQAELFDEFRPLVMSFIDGYNVCFITYGGEASGKTYTLIGENRDASQQGIMQRSLTTILTEERLRQRDWDYKISACLVEIYNDNCIDVLSGETGIQLYVDNGMETAYQKLKSVPITNDADADALIQVCTVKRKVARTALNPASSRSHLIILIRLQGCSKIHGENICSFLCLCDLAGFEDIIKAETQTNKVLSKEAGYINRSLTAFNRVFVSLKKQDPNTVCYRDTKLTHLLKPFLTNSGKCALIVTVRNDKRSVGSTHNTLRFGKETRGVTLGRARRQVNLATVPQVPITGHQHHFSGN